MVLALGVVVTGCAKKEDEVEAKVETPEEETPEEGTPEGTPEEIAAPSFDNVDLSEIVKLPVYKGMELEKVVTVVSDETVNAEINSALENAPVEDEDGVVDDGDTANIDYEGKIDGVAFDRGADQGYDLRIGSGSFMPGFEEQLIGAKKGDTFDINVTFPEDYNEELGGKDAVFTITINDVKNALEAPTDEWVAANTEYQTVDEYKAGVKQLIEDYNDQRAESELEGQAWNKLIEESEIIEYPEDALEYGRKLYEQNVQQYADYSGQTIEEFVESQGMTMEQYNQQMEDTGKDIGKQVLVMNAVAQAEGIKVGDETYNAMLAQFVEESQMPEEAFIETYGEANVEQNVLVRCVQKVLLENANVKEVEASDVAPESELPEGHSADDGHDH